MEWFIGIAAAVIGAFIWEVGRSGVRNFKERQGELGGYWYQLTFDPIKMVDLWSIELVEMKKDKNELRAKMWRIYRHANLPYYDRAWGMSAHLHSNGFIRGTYWSTNGEGGDGGITLLRKSRSNYEGEFREEPLDEARKFTKFEAPLKWIKAGSEGEQAVLQLVKAQGDDLSGLDKHARKILIKRLSSYSRTLPPGSLGLLAGLAYGGALQDLSLPLAAEAGRMRQRGGAEQKEVQAAEEDLHEGPGEDQN